MVTDTLLKLCIFGTVENRNSKHHGVQNRTCTSVSDSAAGYPPGVEGNVFNFTVTFI
jgi:hypothetical protein